MYSTAYVWAKVLAQMEVKWPSISTWFDDAEVLELTGETLTLYTPTDFRQEFIKNKASAYIREVMRELFGMEIEVEVQGDRAIAAKEPDTPDTLMFNPQFTFENFVVGPSNRFAHAAALAVAKKPAESYNPLFIYGPSGLGKTHLLYAIANEIHRAAPHFRIVYIKGDQFTNELISAIQQGKNVEFRSKYRGADLFLVDDIQFIAGKASTQEEFFHTFNTLYEAKKQIVLTSDRPPKEMNTLEDRLLTRFEWGLIADIQPPDYETRVAIIRNKARSLNLVLPDDVCEYISNNVTSNVRQIEGAVNKIKANHDLNGMKIDVASVSRCITDMYKGGGAALPTPSIIIAETARFYQIEESVLRSTRKTKGTAHARQIAMYLCRHMTNISYPDIGREFGKHHTTIMYGVQEIEKMIDAGSGSLQQEIADITAAINARL
ncbi:MAG: chromosomal replication initiator protein DnaA [Oscillospiraceae bacterium]|nr:chromosomal replication initiator protein DnaA [Oscillospiraceae bacterium]